MGILTSAAKNKRDIQIQVPILDQNNDIINYQNRVTVLPRYTDYSTAHSKTFSAAGDYTDPSNHNVSGSGWSYDIKVDWNSSGAAWYNYTYDTNSGRRGSSSTPNNGTSLNDYGTYVSLYMDLGVGDGPHPGVGTNYTHFSVLYNQAGAYHALYYTGSPTPDYTQARTFPDHSSGAQNIKISGQHYGAHQYRQWFCLADVQSWGNHGTSYLRIVNHGGGPNGKSKLTIGGVAFIIHGMSGASSGADN